ncbi:hypothetical protein H5410_027258 [Solanum commersonii]|uniref:Replication protein A 70 kDa DNA-binding subunit B/D first OB fold domain-containing protein n=1 Tax=Solanum commersonii TaxID=4109 RepID=A0A9J5Z3X8_SOLCO|nr:hypothetical protein H5410_027258 [Solanum commersonii]
MNWNLKVRVLCFWTVPDKYKPDIPYTMELILQDEKGDQIHASIDKFTIKYFRDKIYDHGFYQMKYFVTAPYHSKFKTNSHKYKLTFTQSAIVTEIEDSSFHMDGFKLCTFEEVEIQHKTDENKLIVVGHVVSYESIQLSKKGENNSSFMNIVVEDEQRNELPATLWGDLAFQMQSHLSGSTDEPLIVVLQLMKTHKFRDLPQSSNFKNKFDNSSVLLSTPNELK